MMSKRPLHLVQSVRRLQTVLRHVSVRTQSSVPRLQQACLSSSSHNPIMPSITAEPRAALTDEAIRITLQNFPPHAEITLHGQVVELPSKMIFASCGQFVSDTAGQIDVATDSSKGGTFSGVEPMGILWSLRPAPSHPQDTHMAMNFVNKPCLVTLKAYLGHLDLEDIYGEHRGQQTVAEPVAELQLERFYRAEGVTCLDVEEGNIRGTLFLPAGKGPFQGVIDMFGSSGGLTEYRAALLASRGFAALSLAYFKYKDLQTSLYDLRYEYFEEAINWLASHPKVVSSGVGVLATSKGTENALLMGANSLKVTAVVSINGYCYATVGNFLRDDKILLTATEIDLEKIEVTEEGFVVCQAMSRPRDIIPIWQGQAKYLFFESQDDYQTKPDVHKDLLAVCPEEKQSDIQVVKYPGAGHLLEPPYNPLCRSSLNKGIGMKMKWGGRLREHAYAQVDAWKRTLEFLRENIPKS